MRAVAPRLPIDTVISSLDYEKIHSTPEGIPESKSPVAFGKDYEASTDRKEPVR